MKLKTEVLRGLKWTAGAKLVSQIFTWGITIFVMRLLQPSDYGLLAMASVALTLCSMFSEFGLGSALVQQAEISTQKLRQAFGIILGVNFSLFLLLNLLAPLIAIFYVEERLTTVIRVLSIQFLIIPFGGISEVLLQRRLAFKQRSLIDLGSAIISSITTLCLALAGNGIWSLIVGNFVASIFRLIAVNCAAPFHELPKISLSGMRSLVNFGGNVTASRFLWFFFTQADTVIIGRLLGGDVLGIYSVSMHLATLPVQRVTSILNQVAFPVFSRFQNEKELIKEQLIKAFGLISFIAFPILWGMSVVAPDLVFVLLGPHWIDAVFPLQALTFIMPFRTIVSFLPTITDAIGRPEVGLHNVMLGVVVMPISFYVGANWGISGVAMTWVTVYPIVLFINMRRMLSVVGLELNDVIVKIWRTIVCSACMYGGVWLMRWMTTDFSNRKLILFTEITIGVSIYILISFSCNRTLIRSIKTMMSKKIA